jgi:hypothetical protein
MPGGIGSPQEQEFDMNRNPMVSLALALAMTFSGATLAQAATGKTLTPQQQRMGQCSHQAKGKHGDERRAFMSSCLRGKSAATSKATDAGATQRDKMKSCNAEARSKSLKGAARKTFLKSCLSTN